MSATKERNDSLTPPSVEERDELLIVVRIAGQNHPLTRVEMWRSGEKVVVRGLEFDLLADAEDLETAVNLAGAKVFEQLEELVELEDSGDATPEEIRALERLEKRVLRIFLAERREESRISQEKPHQARRRPFKDQIVRRRAFST